MADETKNPARGKEAPAPETLSSPAGFKQGVIPGITDPLPPLASSDKVINLSEVREGAGGGGAVVVVKKEPPVPESVDPPAAGGKKSPALEDNDWQEWEMSRAELEARKKKPKRVRPPKTDKGQDIPDKGKAGRTPKAAIKMLPVFRRRHSPFTPSQQGET